MADRQFNPLGNVSAPAGWTLPSNLQLLLKNVYASFDGTGAAGSYQPCIDIISDSGHTVGSYTASTVAAGGSADVTWFPRVGSGSAGSSSLSSQIVRAFGTCGLGDIPNVPSGGSALVSFTTVRTSDATKAAWSNNGGATNDTLLFKNPANGWVQLMVGCSWPAGTKIDCRIFSPDGYDFLHDGFDSMSGYDAVPSLTFNGPNLMDFTIMDFNQLADVQVHVRLSNSDAAASAPEYLQFAVTYFTGLGL